MDLQPRFREIIGKKEFLRNSVGIEHKTGGATLDGTEFDDVTENDYVKAGTAVYKNSDGFYVPWEDPSTDEDGNTESREGAGLTAHDVKIDGGNPVVGLVVAGHPLESKCTGVTDGFKKEVKGYLRFDA